MPCLMHGRCRYQPGPFDPYTGIRTIRSPDHTQRSLLWQVLDEEDEELVVLQQRIESLSMANVARHHQIEQVTR